MNPNEFEEDNRIDPNQLDLEATRQAELFWKWSVRWVDSKENVDKAKQRMDLIEASLQLKCREDPGSFGLPKATEAGITAAVKAHNDYHNAAEALIDARKTSTMLHQAVAAMEMRKRMLEVLVTLHGQQYFAGPSTPRNLGEIWLKQQEASEKNLAKKHLKRRRLRRRKAGK